MEKSGKNKMIIEAKINDHISFKREGVIHEGIVFNVQENSVLVRISNESKSILGYETNNTVVSHKNYSVLYSKN